MVILITGITSGFGRAMAARLSADGHKVYGTHRKATDFLPGVTYIKADAQRDEDCEAAVRQVLDAEGRIDVFINNAGMGIGGPLDAEDRPPDTDGTFPQKEIQEEREGEIYAKGDQMALPEKAFHHRHVLLSRRLFAICSIIRRIGFFVNRKHAAA